MRLVIEEVTNNGGTIDITKTRIVFLTMVKNESRIIERCIRSALGLVDAFVVCDTGSTDNTIDIARRVCGESDKPLGIYNHEWKNFGHNRTLSYQACQEFVGNLGWDLAKTYCLLLDGDMIMRWTEAFNPQVDLSGAGFSIIQKAGSLHYYNARFLRLSHTWKCVGATHEYWSGPGTANLPVEKVWIDDMNDGGSKADKFIRDARLLEEDLKDDPNNGRTWFYLGQTYKDLGRPEDSIKAYQKRIEIGGWIEEVWYSMYMLVKLHLRKGDFPTAEMWANKAMQFHGCRAEVPYVMTQYLREHARHWKAWAWYQDGKNLTLPNDVLFLETEIYKGMFTYEASILHYYLFPNARWEGLKMCLDYLNGSIDNLKHNVWDNMVFYVEPLSGARPLAQTMNTDLWKASSISICGGGKTGLPRIENVRYVNYSCSERGDYASRDTDGIVRTKNHAVVNGCGSGRFMDDELELTEYDGPRIRGLEDVRLWADVSASKIFFTAAAMDRVPEKIYRIVKGEYDWENGCLKNGKVLVPPTKTECEKNWLQVAQDQYIYGWSPFIVCNDSGSVIKQIDQVPWIFKKMRGSATPVRIGSELIAVVHSVHHHSVRQYFHYLVALHPDTFVPLRWSHPFNFTGAKIEYCLGFESLMRNGEQMLRFLVSIHDSNPVEVTANISRFRWESLTV